MVNETHFGGVLHSASRQGQSTTPGTGCGISPHRDFDHDELETPPIPSVTQSGSVVTQTFSFKDMPNIDADSPSFGAAEACRKL